LNKDKKITEAIVVFHNPMKDITFTVNACDVETVKSIQHKHKNNNFVTIPGDTLSQFLKEKFTSKDRGGLYKPDLPSVSQIVNALYPRDLETEYGLIEWFMKIDHNTNEKNRQKGVVAMSKGTYVHKILELVMIDKMHGEFEPDANKYVLLALSDGNYSDNEKSSLTYLGSEVFSNFSSEISKFTPLYNELYVCGEKTQGSIDMVAYVNSDGKNRLSIVDFKTTSKVNFKKSPIFYDNKKLSPYKRQLCLYQALLKESGINIPQGDFEDIEYMVYQFHLVAFRHKCFEFDKKEILALRPKIARVLDWFWLNVQQE
jgi:hypothetical protein